MNRPTKERLEEIRKYVGFDVSDYDMVGDLFAEIDALNIEWNTHEDRCRDMRADLVNLEAKNARMAKVLTIMADIGLCKGCTKYNEEVLTKFGEWEKKVKV